MNIVSIIVVHPLDGNNPYNAARINTLKGPIDMPLTPEQASLLVELSQISSAPEKSDQRMQFRESNSSTHWDNTRETADSTPNGPDYPDLGDDPIYLREAAHIVNAYGDEDDDDI